MSINFYNLLSSFDKRSMFDGGNWADYKLEFSATFRPDTDLYAHFGPSSSRPPASDVASRKTWDTTEANAFTAIYKTIDSRQIKKTFCKDTKTAAEIWAALVAEYQKDVRSVRFELKSLVFNPVHDPAAPIDEYIDGITNAAESLGSIGHTVEEIELVDSIIMHLDVASGWAVMRSLLIVRETDPKLPELKGLLREYEKNPHKFGVDGGTALYSKGKGKKREKRSSKKEDSGTDSASDSDSFDWLNTKGRDDVCHRCGRPGHRSSRCMANMPQRVRDKIIKAAEARRAHAHRTVASDSESDGPVTAHNAHFLHAARGKSYTAAAVTTQPITRISTSQKHCDPQASGAESSSYSSDSDSDSEDGLAGYTIAKPSSSKKGKPPDVAKEARAMLQRLQV